MKHLLFLIPFLFAMSSFAQDNVVTIEGDWVMEWESTDIGLVKTVMTFDEEDTGFVAYTRRGADRDILGFWKSALARTFTSSFKKGSLLRITNGSIDRKGDTLILFGILRSAIGSYYFNGTVYAGSLKAQLTDGNGKQRGKMNAVRDMQSLPLDDYPAIVDEMFRITKDKIYNPSVLKSKGFKKFRKQLESTAPEIQDDIEMLFAFFYYSESVPFSHYFFMKPLPEIENDESAPEKRVFLEERSPETAYMKITSFSGSAEEMDSVFSVVRNRNYKNLIVDLRNNPGGSVEAGMAFATNVADTTFYGGVFLTQKWYATHDNPPNIEEYPKLPHFTETSFDLLLKGIHKEEGLCLKVIPQEQTYDGKLYILTNKNTASTCEPIVYGLQQYNRATIIGEKTAGAMLNGEHFNVASGYKIVIPTVDYYTADGYRIDQKGVIPDIETDDALEYIEEYIVEKEH